MPQRMAWSVHERRPQRVGDYSRGYRITWSLDMTCILWSSWCKQWHQRARPVACIQRYLPWKSHNVPFQANGVAYKRGYYLTDGIYPPLSVFVKSFTCPNDPKRKKFKEAQESARKDVERVFGVLKRSWQVLTVRSRSYEVKRLQHVMYACIILHNMILEEEGKSICRYNEN